MARSLFVAAFCALLVACSTAPGTTVGASLTGRIDREQAITFARDHVAIATMTGRLSRAGGAPRRNLERRRHTRMGLGGVVLRGCHHLQPRPSPMTTAPCLGPRSRSIFEWIGYAALLVAAAAAGSSEGAWRVTLTVADP